MLTNTKINLTEQRTADTHYEKQLITPLGYFKFFRPPHCLQQTHENETIATINIHAIFPAKHF
jgi:hypothetical protein